MTTQTTQTTQTTTTTTPATTQLVDEKGNPVTAAPAAAAATPAQAAPAATTPTAATKVVVAVEMTEAEYKARIRQEALASLKSSLAKQAIEAAQLGASPRMEMRITAQNFGEASKIAKFFGDPAAEEAAVVAEMADRADIAASPASWLGGVWGARHMARTSASAKDMLTHQQTKLLGRLNQAGADFAVTVHKLATMAQDPSALAEVVSTGAMAAEAVKTEAQTATPKK